MSGPAVGGAGTVGRHVGNLVSRDIVNRVTRFAAAVLLARALTLEDYGIVNAGIAAAGIALTATSLGLNDLGARQISAKPASAFARSRLAGEVLVVRVGSLGIVCLVALAAVAAFSPSSLLPAALTCGIALAMASSADWILRGRERMKQLGNEIAISGITVLAGAVVLTVATGSASAGLAVILAGEIVGTVLSWYWAGTQPRLRGVSLGRLRDMLTRSWPLALASVAMYVFYANIDTILLATIRDAEEAGLYSAPYRVFLALNAVSIYTAFSFLPMLTRGVEGDDHAPAFALLRRGVGFLLVYGAALLVGAQAFGGEGLTLLFGDEFDSAGPAFVVLCIAIMWFSVGYPLGYGLIARHENRRFMAGAVTGALSNLVLNLALIPPFGVIGAAAATATAFVAACLVWLRGNGLLGREMAPELIAMSAMSLAAVAGLLVDSLRWPAVALTLGVASAMALRLRVSEPEAGG